MGNYLRTIIEAVNTRGIPDYMHDARQKIIRQRNHLQAQIDDEIKIYAVNTLTGHKDAQKISSEKISELQNEIIESHTLPAKDYFNQWVVRYITITKAHQVAIGGTGISVELYDLLLKVATDPNYEPLIPKWATYSSGDVIPGAYFAQAILNISGTDNRHGYSLKGKEGISLINGSYIHLGLCAAQCEPLQHFWKISIASAINCAVVARSNRTNWSAIVSGGDRVLTKILKAFSACNGTIKDLQDPVSIRSLPQIYSALFKSYSRYFECLESSLKKPSDNPLIFESSEVPISQASFVLPDLSITTSALIEAILMISWNTVQRTTHLLSGNVRDIPEDGVGENSISLGLIQVPKLMQAHLDRMRLEFGSRPFARGSSTSKGVEDFWTYGVFLGNQLSNIIEQGLAIVRLEMAVIRYVKSNFNTAPLIHDFGWNQQSPISYKKCYESTLPLFETLGGAVPVIELSDIPEPPY